MRSDLEARRAMDTYGDTVKRLCFVHLKNESDTKDIFQNVFLKYVMFPGTFESPEHEKAWLIRVTMNECKDLLKNLFRKSVSLDAVGEMSADMQEDYTYVFQAVLSLPKKYKDPVYLFYYEGYSAAEIADMLGKKENTIYTRLSRAREMLKKSLGGDEFE